VNCCPEKASATELSLPKICWALKNTFLSMLFKTSDRNNTMTFFDLEDFLFKTYTRLLLSVKKAIQLFLKMPSRT
jgi:hypothetical protein